MQKFITIEPNKHTDPEANGKDAFWATCSSFPGLNALGATEQQASEKLLRLIADSTSDRKYLDVLLKIETPLQPQPHKMHIAVCSAFAVLEVTLVGLWCMTWDFQDLPKYHQWLMICLLNANGAFILYFSAAIYSRMKR